MSLRGVRGPIVELDANAAARDVSLSADVCIVGAGPVGLVLADELSRAGRDVLLLESGDTVPRRKLEELNAVEVIGEKEHVLTNSRFRGIGGTASLWNTCVFGGMTAKYTRLDPIDFERRQGLPHSGWPIALTDLAPYYDRAGQLVCGQGNAPARDGVAGLEFAPGGLINGRYRFGRPEIFTEHLSSRLRASGGVLLVSGATVGRIWSAEGGDRVDAVSWRTLSGQSGSAHARDYILAAGGIENARLLLAAEDFRFMQRSHRRWLGRGFMEHPVDASMLFESGDSRVAHAAGYYLPHQDTQGRWVMGRIGLSESLLRHEGIRNASLRLIQDPGSRAPVQSLFRAVSRRAPGASVVKRSLKRVARLGYPRVRRSPKTTFAMLVDLEQAPHPENRLILSDARDHLGQPRVKLYWNWRAEDRAQAELTLGAIRREMESNGFGVVRDNAASRLETNTHHHIGATRMHAEPEGGVVDPQLRVHGIENLFVVGSSVFPTAGWANPTLTSLALALRLADHLGRAE